MDLHLRRPRHGYKHEPIQRFKLSDDEFFIIIWIRGEFILTAYEDIAGCRYLHRKSRIRYNEDGVRYVMRDKRIYYLKNDIS